ncbi:MAG: substrate-binding domain-containing protein [Polyangiaceae bacterium]|nr:substrate-binding domain-containing protein [Polyangiaceae bacterium]
MHIILAVSSQAGYADRFLRGVAAYAQPAGRIHFDRLAPSRESMLRVVESKADGIIALASDLDILCVLENSSLPVVCGGAPLNTRRLHQVQNDEQAIARMAFEHLMSRGYRNFAATVTRGGHPDSRLLAFGELVRRQGWNFDLFDRPAASLVVGDADYKAALTDWLKNLPKPVGVFCAQDTHAFGVLQICAQLGLDVPREIGVVGVDNYESVCLLSEFPLSSVDVAAERSGYEAMALLERQIAGPSQQPEVVIVPPIRVVPRRSTDTGVADDRLVCQSLTIMRENLSQSLSIELLCDKLLCSRRSLERRFIACLGVSPAQAWARLRVEEVQRLLMSPELQVREIAARTGFTDSRTLAANFRKTTGMTPTEFRRLALPGRRND